MRNQRRVFFFAGLIIFLGLLAALGYRYWYQPTYDFYSTDDATVTGSLVHVAAPGSGQVVDVLFDVGSTVKKGDSLATIKVVSAAPSAVSAAPSISRVLARVTSPVDGTVAAQNVSVGDTLAAGQPIATIVDMGKLWVVANADEARADEIHPGLTADVEIPAGNQTFRGQVVEIGAATTDVTAPPSLGLTGSSSDTTKKVPVKITFDYSGVRLASGMSATVTIYTRPAPQ